MRKYLFLLVIFNVASAPPSAEELGRVSGRVLTGTEDQPVAAASVYLESLDGPNPGRPSITKTNAEGRFSIETHPGKYAVHVFKTDDGYPDIFFAFNLAPDEKLKEVTISAGQHLDGIDIRLGRKAAVLVFTITDAQTGLVLPSVDYELCQVKHPDWCLRGGAPGKTEFNSPPTEIAIRLGSPGFKTIRYPGNDHASVSLAPGERKEISVALQRVK